MFHSDLSSDSHSVERSAAAASAAVPESTVTGGLDRLPPCAVIAFVQVN